MSDPGLGRLLRLRPDARLEVVDGVAAVHLATRVVRLGPLPPGGVPLLEQLEHGAAHGAVVEVDGMPSDALRYLVDRLDRAGLLSRALLWQADPVLQAIPIGPEPSEWGSAPSADLRFRLSRFARMRRWERGIALESPRCAIRLVLADRRLMPLLMDLGRSNDRAGLEATSDLPSMLLDAVLGLMLAHRMLVVGSDEDDERAELGAWEAPELLAHRRARRGYEDTPRGKLRPSADGGSAPAVAPTRGSRFIELRRPPIEDLRRLDPPLAEVMESRRTTRVFDARPPTVDELAELLYRTLRARHRLEPAGGFERGDRPHPSAGACYPLEAYLVVHRCDGLDAGLHHYDPLHHRLGRLDAPWAEVEPLLEEARHGAGVDAPAPLLLVLTARFERTAAAYGPLALTLILQEVGVVLQSLYLAATAMGLAACALGTGDSARMARVAGLDPLREASVGEMMLGRPRAAHAAGTGPAKCTNSR